MYQASPRVDETPPRCHGTEAADAPGFACRHKIHILPSPPDPFILAGRGGEGLIERYFLRWTATWNSIGGGEFGRAYNHIFFCSRGDDPRQRPIYHHFRGAYPYELPASLCHGFWLAAPAAFFSPLSSTFSPFSVGMSRFTEILPITTDTRRIRPVMFWRDRSLPSS